MTARDVGTLARFTVTKDGGLHCLACDFAGDPAEIGVPSGYRFALAWLVRIADEHNRVLHERKESDMTPLTPDEAWETLGLAKTPFEDSPLDYADADQKSKSVFLNGERWAVLIMRKGRD